MQKGNEFRTTVICVDSYDKGVLVGRFYNPSCEAGVTFESLSQFLVKMEDMLDGMKLPQSFSARRNFGDAPSLHEEAAAESAARQGKLATFGVRILFRQNASWQGSVSWLEEDRDESFRSVLELIFLMDSALKRKG